MRVKLRGKSGVVTGVFAGKVNGGSVWIELECGVFRVNMKAEGKSPFSPLF